MSKLPTALWGVEHGGGYAVRGYFIVSAFKGDVMSWVGITVVIRNLTAGMIAYLAIATEASGWWILMSFVFICSIETKGVKMDNN